jgi:hypothetical protein
MASNALTQFQPGAVPAHVQNFLGGQEANTAIGGITVPSLSPQGKVWTISLDGQKTQLQKRDNDGEMVPVGVMRVVILDFAKRRGRAYYEGSYDPDKESAPLCWSDDGITPDNSSTQLQSKKCAECPKAVKGSKVTDQGKATAACSQHRMLALVPANKLDFAPLRLKIAITSDFDKQSPNAAANTAAGWFAFSNYLDYLKSSGVTHTAAVVTKMKFDAGATYPKILFAADRWLTPEELAVVGPLTKDEEVQKLLGGTWTPAGPDGTLKDDTTAGAGEGVAATEQQVTTEQAATADEDEGDGEIIMGLDAPAAEETQAPAQATKPAPKAAKTNAAPKAAAAEVQPEVATVKDPALAALLADWGND